jgi:hypothetical protein
MVAGAVRESIRAIVAAMVCESVAEVMWATMCEAMAVMVTAMVSGTKTQMPVSTHGSAGCRSSLCSRAGHYCSLLTRMRVGAVTPCPKVAGALPLASVVVQACIRSGIAFDTRFKSTPCRFQLTSSCRRVRTGPPVS